MTFYVYLGALFGIFWIIWSMIRAKKAEGIAYGKLDKAGVVTNILLTIFYVMMATPCLFIGLLCQPAYDGFLGIIGGILCIIADSAILLCGLGIGFSISLRRKGKSKLSFAAQFMGVVGIAMMFLIFFSCYGNLLEEVI